MCLHAPRPRCALPPGPSSNRLQVDHLVSLGVNAVELLPIFEYDELEFQRLRNPREHMVNMWGYSHIHTLSPNSRFATAGVGPVAAAREFKEMVKRWVPGCCVCLYEYCNLGFLFC